MIAASKAKAGLVNWGTSTDSIKATYHDINLAVDEIKVVTTFSLFDQATSLVGPLLAIVYSSATDSLCDISRVTCSAALRFGTRWTASKPASPF